jgi:hypothetical protein
MYFPPSVKGVDFSMHFIRLKCSANHLGLDLKNVNIWIGSREGRNHCSRMAFTCVSTKAR